MKANPQLERGTVVLVALCFVAALGISLATYIALSTRAMTLSNRAIKQGLAEQLAELGVEEGLRVMNRNLLSGTDATAALADWSNSGTSANWTLDTTNKRASCTITFPAGKFGTGITATVKVRVDNYDVASVDSTWSSSTTYRPDTIIGHTDGRWYRVLSTHTNKAPTVSTSNSIYWTQEHSLLSAKHTWTNGNNYNSGDMVLRSGVWYRCSSTHTASSSNAPPSSNWTTVPNVSADDDLRYVNESVLIYYGYWYRYYFGWDGYLPFGTNWPLAWFWKTSNSYSVGDVVYQNNIWYRCHTAHTSGASFATTNWNTATTEATSSASAWAWSASTAYNVGDVVFRSSQWYRCRIAHSNQTPGSTSAYWATAPALNPEWNSRRQYSQNDIVRYNGLWYLSLQNSNYGRNPGTQTAFWSSTNDTSRQWNATTAYAANTYRSYGGVWYRCLAANTGISPNHTTYWTPTWSQSPGASTGAAVIYAEATVGFSDGAESVTQVRAAINRSPIFPNALGASTTLTVSGGTATIDSYNSVTDPTAGAVGFAAVLTGGSTGTTAITLGSNTTVKGYLAAPSYNGSPNVSYAANVSLTQSDGSVSTAAPTAPNVDLTRISRSPNIPQFDIQPPPSYTTIGSIGSPVSYGTPGSTTPVVYTRDGNLNLNGSNNILTILGPVVINIQGSLQITSSSTAKIVIAETGSLRLHVRDRLRLDSSGGGIENLTLDPKKCIIISTATSDSHNFSTTQPFHGVIYMPNEDLDINASTATIFGAISCRSINVSGNLILHYDTTLRDADIGGIDEPFIVSDWRELAGATYQATMP
jgi:hypothetical protein